MKRYLKMTIAAVVLCMALAPASFGGTITLEGSMRMGWQYSLTTNAFTNAPATAPAIHVVMTVDDTKGGTIDFGGGTVRTAFGPVNISTDYNVYGDGITPSSSGSSAQGNNGHWLQTWLLCLQDFTRHDGSESRWIQFTDLPPMPDPYNFTSAQFDQMLLSRMGGGWSMREDGFGLQTLWQGNITATATPEPGTVFMLAGALLLFGVWKNR